MKLFLLAAAAAFCFPTIPMAQRNRPASVCGLSETETEPALLTICTEEHGMVVTPQPRLYLRLYSDGRGEYETDPPYRRYEYPTRLITKKFRVTPDEVEAIRGFGESTGFQNAPDEFPAYRLGADSSLRTTVTFTTGQAVKRIVLANFWGADYEIKKVYPPAVFGLMERAQLVRERAEGIVRPIPAISYCELLYDRDRYLGQKVSINADLELNTAQPNLYDSNCDSPAMRDRQTQERIGVGYADPALGRAKTEQIRTNRFGSRAHVLVVGILRDESARALDTYNFRFEISEFKSMDPIILPYQGELEVGWMYTDGSDHVPAQGLQFSSPLKAPPHYAVRVEWTNVGAVPLLKKRGRRYITFRVLSKTIQAMGNDRWNDEYTCELLTVEPPSR
jgi:hypothetical protein